MFRFINYYGRFQNARGRLTGLPPLARLILAIFALPGVVLLCLSIVAVLVSLLALLLLTVPVYRLLSALFSARGEQPQKAWAGPEIIDALSPASGRRHVEVKIVE